MNFYDILKGKFLVSDAAMKNWRFILFCMLLAIVMIASSHSVDQKVFKIAHLEKNMRELRSEFIHTRKHLMKMRLQSNVMEKLESTEIEPSEDQPNEILIIGKEKE